MKLAESRKAAVAPVHEFSKEAEDVIAEVEGKIGQGMPEEQKRFFAIKLLEKDDKINEHDDKRSGCICRDQRDGR